VANDGHLIFSTVPSTGLHYLDMKLSACAIFWRQLEIQVPSGEIPWAM
jgi:hypothetical protein